MEIGKASGKSNWLRRQLECLNHNLYIFYLSNCHGIIYLFGQHHTYTKRYVYIDFDVYSTTDGLEVGKQLNNLLVRKKNWNVPTMA